MANANRKLVKFLKQLFASAYDQAQDESERMLDRQEFYTFLEKERYRADRLASPFSLILLPPLRSEEEQIRCLKELDRIVKPQIRFIDEMGWFNDQQIAIYLFNTAQAGAHSFLKRLQASADCPSSLSDAEILVYPDTISEIRAPEQRHQDRHDLELSANLLLQGQNEQTTTRDISARGVFLLTNTPLTADSKVDLDITLPLEGVDGLDGQQLALRATGKVVRSESHGVAIEFQSAHEKESGKALESEA